MCGRTGIRRDPQGWPRSGTRSSPSGLPGGRFGAGIGPDRVWWLGNVRARWALRSAPAVDRPPDPDHSLNALTGPRTAGWAPSGASLLMSFDGLGLSPELLLAVSDEGYTIPTPVQAAAIPAVLEGRDVLAGAQTGTGKTAAFVLPILQTSTPRRRDGGEKRHRVRVLVVVPTRELAIQVEESFRTYGAPPAGPLRHGLWRRRHRAPDHASSAPAPRSSSRRRAACSTTSASGTIDLSRRRDPRPRRGRPDARHGLHPRHPQDPRAAARRAARTCCSRRPSRTRSAISPTACSTTRR